MSTKKINDCTITADEFNKVKISAMSDRPNAMSSYGGAKKNAADVKRAFDKPLELLIAKHNDLVQFVSDKNSELNQNEDTRKDAEEARVNVENAREAAETARIDAENARAEAELAREAAEEKRNETIGDVADALKKLIDYQDAVLQGYHGGELPVATTHDNGKIIEVVDGEYELKKLEDSSINTYVDGYISAALGGDY